MIPAKPDGWKAHIKANSSAVDNPCGQIKASTCAMTSTAAIKVLDIKPVTVVRVLPEGTVSGEPPVTHARGDHPWMSHIA